MRDVSEVAAAMLATSHYVATSVGIFYDGEPTVDEVPIVDGSLDVDGTQAVPGTLSVALPRFLVVDDVQVDLLPDTEGSPLGSDGHQLAVTYLIDLPGAEREAVFLGWYRVEDWAEEDDGSITVIAASLEALVSEARLLSPVTIAKGATYAAAATTLVGKLLPLEVTAEAAKVTEAQVFEEERLDALSTLVTAWPARMFVDDEGTLQITPPFDDATDPVVFSLTDGEDGTLVRAPRSGKRGIPNAVKASGEAQGDVAPVSAVAYLQTGPRRWNGPYGNVPYFYSSPLLTTQAACLKAAQTILDRLQRQAAELTVTCAPDPRIQYGDVGELTYKGRTFPVRVTKVGLPLTGAGGVMTLVVTEVAR